MYAYFDIDEQTYENAQLANYWQRCDAAMTKANSSFSMALA